MGFSSGGVQIARIFGIPIVLHVTFFFVLIFVTVVLGTADGIFPALIEPDPSETTVWILAALSSVFFFVSILLHELAHSVVAKLYGFPVKNITLFALGGVSQIARESEKASQEFLIAIVGPLSSAVIGGMLFGIWFVTGQGETPLGAMLQWLGLMNLVVAAFNMVPGFPMDGGRVFRSIVWGVTRSRVTATKVASRLGQGIAIAIAGFGLLGLFEIDLGFERSKFGGLWLILIGAFLFNAASAALRSVELERSLGGIRVRDLMSTDFRRVDADRQLRWLAPEPRSIDQNAVFIAVEDDVGVGIVTGYLLRMLDAERFRDATVADVMIAADNAAPIAPTATGAEALTRLQGEGVSVLPVVEDGRLLGLIGLEQVASALRAKPPAPRPAG
jgi:Zn-dependent protease/CBS domain-containing protein